VIQPPKVDHMEGFTRGRDAPALHRLVAGIVDLLVGLHITAVRPIEADASLLLAGLIAFYGLFFSVSTTFPLIISWWVIAFLRITLTTYGKMQPMALGAILMITALFTFFLIPVLLVLGVAIP